MFSSVIHEIAKTQLPYLAEPLKDGRINDLFLVRADLYEPVYGVSEELGPVGSQSVTGSVILT